MRNQQSKQIYRKYLAEMSQVYTQREDIRMFVELVLTLGAIFVFTIFAIRPTLKTIGGLSQQISSKKETIATMDQKIENIQIAQKNFSDESGRLALLEQAVPENPDNTKYFKQIELLAKESGANIFSMNMEQSPIKGTELSAEGEKSINYSLTANGSFESVTSFLSKIESMRRGTIFVTSLMSTDDESTSGGILMTITGQIPYYVVTRQ